MTNPAHPKTVIVTGAASGIGLACVKGLLAAGHRVCGVDLNAVRQAVPEDAVGLSWARWDPTDPGADARFFVDFRTWVEREWPFSHVAYPGRTVSWEDWLSAVV